MDALLVQTGMEFHVSAALVENNGVPHQNFVSVHQETGTVFHVFHVLLVKLGMLPVSHALVQLELIGMVLNVDHVLDQTDIGTSNLMIVFVELETGMVLPVLFVLPTVIGMERPVSLVMEEDFGIHWI